MVIWIIAGGLPFHPCLHEKAQRAHDVKITLIRRQMPTGPGRLTLHNLIRVNFLPDTVKAEKED